MLLLMVGYSCIAYAQEATIKGQVLGTIENKEVPVQDLQL